MGLGEMDAAEAVIDDLVAKLAAEFPNDSDLPFVAADGYYHAASCYRQLGCYEESIQCYQKVICEDSARAKDAYLALGRLYTERKQWNEAANCLEAFLQKVPEPRWPSDVLYELARAYDEMFKLDLAKNTYTKFLNVAHPMHPRRIEVRARIADLLE
jgi:tetratricopeptide (TPR) repeat protein